MFCYLESRVSRVAGLFPRHLPTAHTMPEKLLGSSELTYVLTRYKVQEEGYLAVLEFIVVQPGPIRIQVGIICQQKGTFWNIFPAYSERYTLKKAIFFPLQV